MTNINEQDTQPSKRQVTPESTAKPVVLKGDFAAGERTTPPAPEGPDFARGERTLPTLPVVAHFASGENTLPISTAVGDFASGEHILPTWPENVDLVQPIPPVPVAADHKA